MLGRACAALVIVAGATIATPCAARVQNSASGQIGVVGRGYEGRVWHSTRLNLGLRFESLWFREGPRDFGIGPYVEARTASFGYGEYGGGVLALLPVDMTFPIWLGGGGFARREEGAWAPGFNAFLAWGSRSFNHHGSYGMAYGLLLDVRHRRGELAGTDIVLAFSGDLQFLAYPLLYGISALRH